MRLQVGQHHLHADLNGLLYVERFDSEWLVLSQAKAQGTEPTGRHYVVRLADVQWYVVELPPRPKRIPPPGTEDD